uniref:Uncharacterized protein n=1 Tax=Onchocerca volvulus TaxID=6282 RepID=A0A8R1TY54_ONCVO
MLSRIASSRLPIFQDKCSYPNTHSLQEEMDLARTIPSDDLAINSLHSVGPNNHQQAKCINPREDKQIHYKICQ